ncbi:hypothetical protein TNCV_1446281 [Trichonephila clavipes]|nr:hypothetical protein TNCV_1446281 [Trichonephila clavipes]
MFSALPVETSHVLETTTTTSNTIPSTSQAAKQTSKTCKKKRPNRRKLFYKYDDVASGHKNTGRPPTVDNPVRFIERYFVSLIHPTPAKCEPIRLGKVCCPKKDVIGKKLGRKHDSVAMIVELVYSWKSVSSYTR